MSFKTKPLSYPTKAIITKLAKIISQQVFYLSIGERKRDLIEKDKLRDHTTPRM